jgi:hypothetical protein
MCALLTEIRSATDVPEKRRRLSFGKQSISTIGMSVAQVTPGNFARSAAGFSPPALPQNCHALGETIMAEHPARPPEDGRGSKVAETTLMSRAILAAVTAALCSAPARTAPSENTLLFRHRAAVWSVDFIASDPAPAHLLPADPDPADLQPGPVHATAIQHSDAYLTRAKIHRYASYASLPLFGAEVLLGESLYNSGATANKGPHIAVGRQSSRSSGSTP